MVLVVLDTTVLIDILRGRPAGQRVLGLREAGDQPVTTAISIEEVARGGRQSERAEIRRLFDGLLILNVGRAEAELAGGWRGEHASRGVTLQQADCLIAACAVGAGAQLATGNPKDFPMLDVEHWPVGD